MEPDPHRVRTALRALTLAAFGGLSRSFGPTASDVTDASGHF
ncbi:hypothetical protein [Pelomonas cellulosilytica]|nr:hypothetical protein [Pelomonas sp. P8]